MSINFPQGFTIITDEPIDSRLILSYEQMLNMPVPRMPESYFCLCKDDLQFYVYNKNNIANPTTGHFQKMFNDFTPEILTAEEILSLCPITVDKEGEEND